MEWFSVEVRYFMQYGKSQTGLTMIEIMIYIALSSMMMASVYNAFHTQQNSYNSQNNTVEIQQTVRSGIYTMTREVRSAGYDPTRDAKAGFVKELPDAVGKFSIDYSDYSNVENNSVIAFTIDSNGNGSIEKGYAEQIAYRFNSGKHYLERFNVTSGGWEAVAGNVDALNFVYLKQDGTRATVPQDIQYIEIALLVRSRNAEPKFLNTTTYRNKQGDVLCPPESSDPAICTRDHYRRRLLTTTVQIRNVRIAS
jgi:type IV pilus assembly protein PilW